MRRLPLDDSDTTSEDTAVTIDVLANDTDADLGTVAGDTLTVVNVTNPLHGTAAIVGGTQVSYMPDADWNSGSPPTVPDTLQYTVQDSAGAQSIATVSVTVLPIDDAPSANDDNYTINEDPSPAPSFDILANDWMGNNLLPAGRRRELR